MHIDCATGGHIVSLRAEGYDGDTTFQAALDDLRDDDLMRRELMGTHRRVTNPMMLTNAETSGVLISVLGDCRCAWRSFRSRSWRSVLSIGLLAVALGANTVLFAVADSLVFDRLPYRDVEQLVEIRARDARTGRPGSNFLHPPLLDEWRKQTDIFSGVERHLTKVIFLSGAGEPLMVQAADVMPNSLRTGCSPRASSARSVRSPFSSRPQACMGS